jgi:predicted HTH transcriptional regulator
MFLESVTELALPALPHSLGQRLFYCPDRTILQDRLTILFALNIGVEDETKAVRGVEEPLEDEERLANAFADSIAPTLLPDIQIQWWRDRELILILVPHCVGPYYVRSEGPDEGVYVRLGSTNRAADSEMVEELRRIARNTSFDEQPCSEISSEAIDFRVASELFAELGRELSAPKRRPLGLMVRQDGKTVPSNGAVLLFGKNRSEIFPDATIRCARFDGQDRTRFLDQEDIDTHLPVAVDQAIRFVERNTRTGARVERLRREDVPEYPSPALREAIINAVVHADYSITGTGIRIAVFDDRVEVTNPGGLPFGLTLEAAMSGVSRLRNRVIGRIFRDLNLIEQWGSGISRILSVCEDAGLRRPAFEELGTNFRVILYSERRSEPAREGWELRLLEHIGREGGVQTREAAEIWETSPRTARTRLKKLVESGDLTVVGSGPRDPNRKYVLKE